MIPQFRQIVTDAIYEEISTLRIHLESQTQASLDTLRTYQGQIAGYKGALEILDQKFKEMY